MAGQLVAALIVTVSPLMRLRELPREWDGGTAVQGEPVADRG